jgi:predicted metal-binding protein
MMETNELIQNILALGAGKAALIPADQIVLAASFRDACAQNSCGAYGKYWVCPPACGEIDMLMARVRSFDQAILYQSVGHFEDSFDFEGMIAARRAHGILSRRIEECLSGEFPADHFHLSVGGCDLCTECTYSEGLPCRHPDKTLLSLEACGVDVYQTAKAAGLPYNNGPNTVTYFGLILFGQSVRRT